MYMKNKLYLLPALLLFAASCSKSPAAINYQLTLPKGNYTGTFYRFHQNQTTLKADTTSASIMLTLNGTNFTVTGDTSKLHAGSFGTYALGTGSFLTFKDKTEPTSGTPAKVHLNGNYNYVQSA